MSGATGLLAVLLLGGCAGTTVAKVAGAAASLALEGSGLTRKNEHKEETSFLVPLRIQAGQQLNLTSEGRPLSLVIRIYHLSATDAFERMSYAQATTPEDEGALLADDMLASREVVLIPGRTYDIPQTLPTRATAIGIVGQFRAPKGDRWKLAFDARASREHGITVGALACTLVAGTGAVINQATADLAQSPATSRCNG